MRRALVTTLAADTAALIVDASTGSAGASKPVLGERLLDES